jgi:hypothetical protein
MRRIILAIGLISFFIGIMIISISSIRVPDPLHSTSTVSSGKIGNESKTIFLNDVQKGKNISLSIIRQNSINFLNIRVVDPKGTLLFDQNSSQPLFITIIPPVSGNYSAVLTNTNNEDIYIESMFGSAILFDSNRNPKIEIHTVLIGVIILLIGIATCILWIILEFFERLRRVRYKQVS